MIKNEESLQLYNQLLETIADNNPVERAYLLLQISQLYIRLQKYDDAVKYINEAEQFYAAEFAENNPYSIMIPDLKGNIYWNKNELETAEKYYLEAVANAKKILPPDHPAYIKTMKTIALFYFNNNRFSESLIFHNELLENYLKNNSPEDLTVVEQKLTVALIYHNLEMHDEAIELLTEAIEAEPDGLTENSHKMMVNLYNYYSAEE
jgi:tetratricopeptide (TPR) repeat protein